MNQTHDLQEIQEQVPAWIEELESGCYEQTSGALCDEVGYCCFGVADVVIFGESFASDRDVWADSSGDTEMLSADKLSLLDMNTLAHDADIEAFHQTLRGYYHEPEAARLRASLCTDEDGEPARPPRYAVLAALNDASVPFEAIARYIRASGWLAPLLESPNEG